MGNSRKARFRFGVLLIFGLWSGIFGLRAATDYLSPPWQADTFAGYTGSGSADGAALTATFNEPSGIALDAAGNTYIADARNSTIRRLSPGGFVSTVAGNPGVAGIADGAAASSLFNFPFGLAAAADGTLFIADTGNHLIRKITPSGVVSTLAGSAGLAGSANGTGAAARFNAPTTLAYDATSGVLYITDTGNHTIRSLVVSTGVVATLAGTATTTGSTVNGSGANARFNSPIAIALNAARTSLYVADQSGQTIRQIVIAGATVTTIAGGADTAGSIDATGTSARFNQPKGLALDGAGYLYITEANACRVRRLQLSNNQVTTLAGGYLVADSVDATGTAARFNQPSGIVYDATGARLLVTDSLNSKLRTLNVSTLAVTTLAGPSISKGSVDGTRAGARFRGPRHIARDNAGNLYLADRDNHILRKITSAGVVTTLAGLAGTAGTVDGTGSAARFNQPVGVAVTGDGSLIYVSEATGQVVRRITSAGVVTTLAGGVGVAGTLNGTGTAARFDQPAGLALDAAGNVYVADFGNHAIRRITPGGVVTTFAGTLRSSGSADGDGLTLARFQSPFGVACDTNGNVYVADSYNQTIRKITASSVVSTYAGSAGLTGTTDAATAGAARFFYPFGVAVDAAGKVYVADYASHLIRRIETTGVVKTVAGTPSAGGGDDGLASAARFRNPQGLAVSADGGTLYVSDTENNAVRLLYPALAPEISSPLTAVGNVGVSFSNYTIAGSRFPYLFGATGLPPGLSVSSSGGLISGVPYQAGIFSATITAENAGGITAATVVFTIGKGNASITLTNLSQPYDGAVKTPTATTAPSGFVVTYTYNGSATAPSAYGTYDVIASINDANYQGTASATMQIAAPISWIISTLAASGLSSPSGIAVAADGALYIADSARHVIFRRTTAGIMSVFAGTLNIAGYVNATGTAAKFNTPSGLAFDTSGNLYVADSGNHRIRRISTSGVVTLVAGSGSPDAFDGTGASAAFNYPLGLAFAPGGVLYVADSGNYALRRIVLPAGVVTTFQTSNGLFDQPTGLAIASDGTIYVSDAGANNLWRITSTGTATLLAGSGLGISGSIDGIGSNALFYSPHALAFGSDGLLYVSDSFNHTLRRVNAAGAVTTLAGLAETSGTADGFGTTARMSGPSGLTFTSKGTLYISDTDNGLLRLASPPPIVPVIATPPSILVTEASALSGYSFTATGTPSKYLATGLPPGLTLNPSTGALTGTPLESGIYSVILSVTNSLTTVSTAFNLTVNAPSWETWRSQVFNGSQLAFSGISGPAADPDGDGVPNLFEYLQDRDPLVRDTNPALMSWSNGSLTLSYEHLRAAPDWQVIPEQSLDLQTWNRGPSYVEPLEIVDLDARRQQIKVRSNAALGLPNKVFLRLVVEPKP